MREMWKRLTALNLAMLLLLTLAPVPVTRAAAAESGRYAYYNTNLSGSLTGDAAFYSDTLNVQENVAGFSLQGGLFVGWALTPGGMPVASADEVPENTTALYACWGKEAFYSSESSLQIYNGVRTATSVDGTVVYPGKSASGTGWAWENGTLTLTEDYSGGPIQAAGGLELHTTGNVTITGTDGPAISAKSKVILWTETSGKLTLQGGSGAPAVETTGTLYVHTPGHVEMAGGNTAALSANTWDLSSLCDSYSLRNRVFAGASAADAAETTSYSEQTYLRVQPVERTLIYDLQGGQTKEGVTGKLEKTKYYSTAYTLDDLPEVTREGYAFMGWCTYSNGSNLWKDQYYENGDAISLTYDATLYAIWQKIPEGPYVTLDAGSDYIDSEDCSYRPRWMLPLDGLGMAELPRLGSGCAWALNARGLLTEAVVDDPTLFYPGMRYDLSGVETLYGVAGKEHYSMIYGNGHLSINHAPAILVKPFSAATPSSLWVYRNHFYDSEAVVVDLNTKADGSGESLYETRGDVYLQWQKAGAGSVVLYSPSGYAANDWAYRYTRVLTGEEAKNFDFKQSYGVSRPGWYLDGWTDQEKNGTPLTEMPEPGDENGRYYLFTAWEPWTLTCVYSGSSTTTKSGSDGFVSVGAPTYPSLPQSLYYLGWNTKQDGTGDWYAGKWALDGDLTLYQQTAEKTSDSVLLVDYPATGRNTVLTGTADGSGNVTVTLPDDQAYWSRGNWAYPGGTTITVTAQTNIYAGLRGDYFFISETVPYANQAVAENFYTSYSSLVTFPTQSEFGDNPGGKTLKGWSTTGNPTDLTDLQAPGTSVYYYNLSDNSYYAVWDGDQTVYVTLNDPQQSEPMQLRGEVGQSVILPCPTAFGYRFLGWLAEDGTIYPAGSSYVLTAAATLTAQWKERAALVVNGISYERNGNEYWVNGEAVDWNTYWNNTADGWSAQWYENSSVTVYLRNYQGGPIYLPGNSWSDLQYTGTNVIHGADGEPALSAKDQLDIRAKTAMDGSTLTVQGGSGAPAVEAKSVTLDSGDGLSVRGGAHASAVNGQRVSISGGHVTLEGGEGQPAITTTESGYVSIYSSDIRCFAGDSRETAESVTKYTGQHMLYTQPIPVTVTLDGQGGIVHGRSIWTETWEKGVSYNLQDVVPQRRHAFFRGWNTRADGSGEWEQYSINPSEDTTLYAIWDTLDAEQVICLKNEYVSPAEVQLLALPDSGTITLPQLADLEDGRFHVAWGHTDGDNYTRFPAGIPLDVEMFRDGMTLEAEFAQQGQHVLFCMGNGHPFEHSWCASNWGSQSSFNLYSRSSGDGYWVESWNTKPDGSGTRYEAESTVTFEDGQRTLVLYAQWSVPTVYVTKANNERLPWAGQNAQFWTNEARTELYPGHAYCSLPAGTTLYSVAGIWEDDCVLFDNTGAATGQFRIGNTQWRSGETTYSLQLSGDTFQRDGYVLTGWNTERDGSGTAYGADQRIVFGTCDANGSNWTPYETSPCRLYAQWAKAPSHTVPIPLDMQRLAEPEDTILVAAYDVNGRMVGVVMAASGAELAELYGMESGTTYQVMLIAGEDAVPLCLSERNSLQ